MTECNYDEVTHSIYPSENLDPMYHWDAHFPERLSRLHLSLEFSSPAFRRSRRAKERCTGRYKTQPITFGEITEVDEDSSNMTSMVAQDQENYRDARVALFRNQVPLFSRSVDGLVASGYLQAKSGTSTGSDKENTPCNPDLVVDVTADENQPQTNPPDCSFDASGDLMGLRHRRKRSGRRLRNRNAVPEEVPETEKNDESNIIG